MLKDTNIINQAANITIIIINMDIIIVNIKFMVKVNKLANIIIIIMVNIKAIMNYFKEILKKRLKIL